MVSVPVGPVGIQRVSSHLPRAGDLSCRRRKISRIVSPLGEPKIPTTEWESTPAKGWLRGGRTVVGISKQTGSRKCNPVLIGQPLLKPSELNFSLQRFDLSPNPSISNFPRSLFHLGGLVKRWEPAGLPRGSQRESSNNRLGPKRCGVSLQPGELLANGSLGFESLLVSEQLMIASLEPG